MRLSKSCFGLGLAVADHFRVAVSKAIGAGKAQIRFEFAYDRLQRG